MLDKTSNIDLNQEVDALIALFQAGKIEQVVVEVSTLLRQLPNSIALLNIKGIACSHLKNFREAINAYNKAVQIDPENSITHFNLGVALQDNGQFSEALETYTNALRINPQYLQAIYNIGTVFEQMEIIPSAINYYNNSLAINPIESMNSLYEAIGDNSNSYSCLTYLLFHLNYSPDLSAEAIFDYYQRYDAKYGKKVEPKWSPFKVEHTKNKRIKIGYVSPNFSKHSIRHLLEPILANHDHKKFEVYAFAETLGKDLYTERYKNYFDHWIPTEDLNDQDLASKIYDLGIDILIDLAGHTQGNRLDVFMHKPAPVSLSWWLGFGYTTGLSAIDYFLADRTLVPEGSEHLFAEKVWKMDYPCSSIYQPDPTAMGPVNPLPALTNGFVTFGSLTRSIRLNDRVIRTWSNILKKVPHSKLIIDSKSFQNDEARENFIKKFELNGITKDRLDIGFNSPPWDTLRKIDIGLDCFPHNSGTTLVEHLYMGNPYITLASRPSVGRIGSHYLTAAGHSEWIVHSEEEYVEKACELSSNLEALSKIRGELRSDMENSPLRDEKAFVKQLENTYQSMWEEYLKQVSK